MNVQTFKMHAKKIRDQLELMEEAREDLADLCSIMKAATGLTNMQMREVKRLLKAEVKGSLDKIKEQDAASDFIRDLLGIDKKSVAQNSVDHDRETGEVYESPRGDGDGQTDKAMARDQVRPTVEGVTRETTEAEPKPGWEASGLEPSPTNTENAASQPSPPAVSVERGLPQPSDAARNSEKAAPVMADSPVCTPPQGASEDAAVGNEAVAGAAPLSTVQTMDAPAIDGGGAGGAILAQGSALPEPEIDLLDLGRFRRVA